MEKHAIAHARGARACSEGSQAPCWRRVRVWCAGSTAASTSVDAGARSRATPAACNGQVGLPAAVCRVDHARRELAVGGEQQKPFRRHIKPAHVREALRVRQARRKQQLDDGRQLWAGGVAPPCGQHAARLVERDDPARESVVRRVVLRAPSWRRGKSQTRT